MRRSAPIHRAPARPNARAPVTRTQCARSTQSVRLLIMTETLTNTPTGPLTADELERLDAYWRAANYLSVGQIYLLDNPLLREPLRARARQAAPARPLGHHAGPELRLRPPQPGHPRARPRRDLRHRPRPRRPGAGRQHLAGGHATARSTRASTQDEDGHAPAVPAVLLPRRHPQPRRAGDAGLDPRGRRARLRAGRTPTAPPSTTPTCSSPASSATARPRPARWRPAGTPTSSSNPARDGAVLPILHLNGYKIANPTVLARIPHDELRALLRGYGYEPLLRRGRRPGDDAPADGRDARRRCSTRSPRSSAGARGRRHRAAALADDRAAHAEGLDRARRRSTACRSRAPGAPTRCRWPSVATNPEHLRAARGVAALATGPRSCSTRTARSRPELAALAPAGRAAHGRQPARQRRPAAARPRAARLPRLRRRRSTDPAHDDRSEATRVLGDFLRDVMRAQRRRANFRLFGPDETASNRLDARLRGHRPGLDGRAPRTATTTSPGRPGHGGALRAPLPGLAGGLPAHRPARPVLLLRGVHPHRRLDGQPARQVAEGHPRTSRGGGRSPR